MSSTPVYMPMDVPVRHWRFKTQEQIVCVTYVRSHCMPACGHHLLSCPPAAGAELANVVNEGALECARRGGSSITSLDIYNGIDRILQVTALLPWELPPLFPCFPHMWHVSWETQDGTRAWQHGYCAANVIGEKAPNRCLASRKLNLQIIAYDFIAICERIRMGIT